MVPQINPTVAKSIIDILKYNYTTLSDAELEKLVKELTTGLSYGMVPLKGTHLYRARVNEGNDLFTDAKQLWYPPKHLVKVGRLNKKNSQVLYLADTVSTALRELRPPEGSWVTIIKCYVQRQLNLIPIGIIPYKTKVGFFDKAYWDREIATSMARHKYNIELIAIEREIYKCLNEHLTKRIDRGDENLYNFSSIYGDHILNAPIMDGIIYPSVTCDLLDTNFAIKPKSANKNLRITNVDVVRIINTEKLIFQTINGSDNIKSDGKIDYNGNISDMFGATAIEPSF